VFSKICFFSNKLIFFALTFISSIGSLLSLPLDDYVKAPDDSYKWSLHRSVKKTGYTLHTLKMTSQSWRSKEEVDRTLWEHWLTILIPDNIQSNKAMLYIDGGLNGGNLPSRFKGFLNDMAQETRTVVAWLRYVPNQRLKFPDDPNPRYKKKGRMEDALLAYSIDKFFKTGDTSWICHFPMTKSAVRAMDTVEAFCKEQKEAIDIEGFVIAGVSKRGWTTWLTAAVDPRIIAFVPVVIDLGNMKDSFSRHYNAYGKWSRALKDYTRMKIYERFGTPEFDALIQHVDPYEYRDRYTMPKYIINSAGDPFFLPDSSQLYFHDLPGQKYLRYIPNRGHNLIFSDAARSVKTFYRSIIEEKDLPRYSWKRNPDNSVTVECLDHAEKVNLWKATNPNARDFRFKTIKRAWKKTRLKVDSRKFTVNIPPPKKGWSAFFVELVFDSGEKEPYKFTTDVFIIPDTFPYSLEKEDTEN
jgi:PhoPQ-activated pathogenicity-related protein